MANGKATWVPLLVVLIVAAAGAAAFFSVRKPAPNAPPAPPPQAPAAPRETAEEPPSPPAPAEEAKQAEEPPAELVARGEELAGSLGCMACHSTDGTTLAGPTWKGLYGSERRLTNGRTVTADDAYLRESILQPDAKVVEGFAPGVMAAGIAGVKDQLSEAETVDALIAYIKSLR